MPSDQEEILKKLGLLREEILIGGEYRFEPSDNKDIERAVTGDPPYLHTEVKTINTSKDIIIDNWQIFDELFFDLKRCILDKEHSLTSLLCWFREMNCQIYFCDGKKLIPINDLGTYDILKLEFLAKHATPTSPEEIYKLAEKIGLPKDKILVADQRFYQLIKEKNVLSLSTLLALDEASFEQVLAENSHIEELEVTDLDTPREKDRFKKCLERLPRLNALTFSKCESALLHEYIVPEYLLPEYKPLLQKIRTVHSCVYESGIYDTLYKLFPALETIINANMSLKPHVVEGVTRFKSTPFVTPNSLLYRLSAIYRDLWSRTDAKSLEEVRFAGSIHVERRRDDPPIDKASIPIFSNLRNLRVILDSNSLELMFDHAPCLTTLYILNYDLSSLQECKLSPHEKVHTLAICDCTISEEFFRQLPVLFPNLEFIKFNNVHVKENLSLETPIQLNFNKLKSFHFINYVGPTSFKIASGFRTLITPSLMELKLQGFVERYFLIIARQGELKKLRHIELIDPFMSQDEVCYLFNCCPEDLATLHLTSPYIFFSELLYNVVNRFSALKKMTIDLNESPWYAKFKENFPNGLIKKHNTHLPLPEEKATKKIEVSPPFTADGQPLVANITLDAKTEGAGTAYQSPILFKTKDPFLDQTGLYRLKVFNRLNAEAKPFLEAKWEDYKNYKHCDDIAAEFERNESKNIAYSSVEIPPHSTGKQVLASLSPNEKITHIQIISDDPHAEVKLFYDTATRTYGVEVKAEAPVQLKYMLEVDREAYEMKYAPDAKFQEIIDKYKSYEPGELKVPSSLSGRALLEAIQNQTEKPYKGTCLHRSYGCFDELLRLGYNVNLVSNSSHIFIEWQNSAGKVYTIDLGGAPGTVIPVPYNENKKIKIISESKPAAPPLVVDSPFKKYEQAPITLPTASPATFLEGLFSQPKVPMLLMLPTAEHIQGLSNTATDYLARLPTPKPYYFVDDLDELRQRPFKKFLQAADTSEEIVLFVRWDKHKPLKPQHAGLNSLFEKTPALDGVTLPKNLRIVALMEQNSEITEDIRSRFTTPRIISVPAALNLPLGEALKPAKAPDEAKISVNVNLYESIDWKKKLLGYTVFKNGVAEFKPGALFSLIPRGEAKAESRSLTVINPPWHLPEFKVFWNKLCKERKFFSEATGEFLTFPADISLNWSSEPYPDRTAVPVASLNERNHTEWQCVLNQATRSRFFSQLSYREEKLNQLPGYLKQYENKPLSVLVTEEMTQGQWEELFDKANEYKCTLNLIVAPAIKMPERFAKTLSRAIPCERKESPVQLITTNDVQFYIEENLRGKNVLTVSHHSHYGLIEEWFTAEGKEANKEGILLKLLREGDVVLKGDFSPALIKRLQTLFAYPPYVEFNGERLGLGVDKPLKGKLFIVSEKNPFPFVQAALRQEVKPEDYWPLVPIEQAELIKKLCKAFDIKIEYFSQIRAIQKNLELQPDKNPVEWLLLLKKNPEEMLRSSDEVYQRIRAECRLPLVESKEIKEEKNELTSRIEKIAARLETLPFTLLMGPSGTGKTTTVLKELPRYYKAKGKDTRIWVTTPPIIENISQWATARDDKMKILFIDEANLGVDNLYAFVEGMLKTPKEIIYNGERIELTDNHKIIFAGNYQHYEKRHLHSLFLKYDCVEHFPRFSSTFELQYQVYPAIVAAFKTDERKVEEKERDAKQVMAIFSDSLERAQALIGKEKLTVRNLQSMSLAFEALWENKALATINENPRRRAELFAKWVFYQNARDVLGSKAEILKTYLFNSVADYDILKKLFPRVRREKRGNIYITSSHKRALAVLEEELAIRQLRSQATSSLGLSCGTRGTLLEGAPGIGKSSVVINHLEQLGYVKAVPGEEYKTAPSEAPKLYYHITPMAPEKMKKILVDAFHQGAVVVIDELNVLPLEGLLNSLMMGIDPNGNPPRCEGFYVMGTQNPISLGNRQALSAATENRFRKIHMPNYTKSSLRKLLVEEHRWASPEMLDHFIQKYLRGAIQQPPYNFRELLSDMAFAKLRHEAEQLAGARDAVFSRASTEASAARPTVAPPTAGPPQAV